MSLCPRQRLIAPVVLLALTMGVFWKLVLTRQYTFLDSPDLTYQVAPWLQVQASAWHRGDAPLLWDPYIGGGQSLIGQMQPATAYPLNWLLFLMPLRNGFIRQSVLHWYFLLIHYLAALACYALCRDLGRSRMASILGGAAFAFAGFVGTTAWPQLLHATVWAPLVLLFSLRAMRGDRPLMNALISGAFLGLEWLGGHHQIPTFTTLAISGIWIFHIATGKTHRAQVNRLILYAALIATMATAGAMQTFPAYSYGHDAVRWAGADHALAWNETVPYSVHDDFSLAPTSVLGIFIDGIFTNSNPFLGITVFLLAISGVVLAWDQVAVRLLASVAAGGLIFAFANFTILHGVLYSLAPFVDKARDPAMAAFLFQLGVCPLSAFGVDSMLSPAGSKSLWIKHAIAASGIVALLIWVFLAVVSAVKIPSDLRLGEVAITALAAALLAGLLSAVRSGTIGSRSASVLLVMLAMLEIGSVAGRNWHNRDFPWQFWPQLSRDQDIANFLRSRPVPFRVELNDHDVPYNFGDWYGIETYFGYVSSAPAALMRIEGDQRARALLGVQYYVGKGAAQAGQPAIFSSPSGIKVFETPGATPRVRAVHDVIGISDAKAAGRQLNDPVFDLSRSAFVIGYPPKLEKCEGDRVRLVRHDPQRVVIEAAMNCRGMVVLGDGYSKDWIATVDGKRAPLYAAYSVIRGVPVDAGNHRIEFRYRPVSVYLGALLTTASFLGVFLIWWRNRSGRTNRKEPVESYLH